MIQVSTYENPFHSIYHDHGEGRKKTGESLEKHKDNQIYKHIERDIPKDKNTHPMTVFFRPYYWLLKTQYFSSQQSTYVNGDLKFISSM